MKKLSTLTVIFFILTGCATTEIWTSRPEIQTTSNPFFNARLKPLTQDFNYYVAFLLKVENITGNPIEIDWNKCRYLLNGQSNGIFVFKGIDRSTLKDSTIPTDIIPPGKAFSKEIVPYKMLARAILKSTRRDEDEKSIYPGPLPAGKNGILLVIRQNGKELRKILTVQIEVAKTNKDRGN